jgi:hypothetical protein
MEIIKFFPPVSATPITHRKPLVQLGSCFSTHISEKLRRAGFQVLDNPNGVIFHPLALAKTLRMCLEGTVSTRFVQKDDVWLDYHSSSSMYALSKNDLSEKLAAAQAQLRTELSKAGHLFLTFGTAHGYRLNRDGEIVANCHQQPSSTFTKELTDLDTMITEWKSVLKILHQHFPQLKVVFTVSPVKYLRDGYTANSLSKARLLELVHALNESYFPAYELITDQLRDHRYFQADGAHPNMQAIDAVWSLFQEWYFEDETQVIVDQMEVLRRESEHRLLYPESERAQDFQKKMYEKRESFLSLHPEVTW